MAVNGNDFLTSEEKAIISNPKYLFFSDMITKTNFTPTEYLSVYFQALVFLFLNARFF